MILTTPSTDHPRYNDYKRYIEWMNKMDAPVTPFYQWLEETKRAERGLQLVFEVTPLGVDALQLAAGWYKRVYEEGVLMELIGPFATFDEAYRS